MKTLNCIVLLCAGWFAGTDEIDAQSQYIRRGDFAGIVAVSGAAGRAASGYGAAASYSFFGTVDLGVGAGWTSANPQGYGATEAWIRWIGCDIALFPLNRDKDGMKSGVGLHWALQNGTRVDRTTRPYYPPSDYVRKSSQSLFGIIFFSDVNHGEHNKWQFTLELDAGSSNGSSVFGLVLAIPFRADISPDWKFLFSPEIAFLAGSGTSAGVGLTVGTIF
jgi:hypothetical protein